MRKLVYLIAISIILVSCGGQTEKKKEEGKRVSDLPVKKVELPEKETFGKEFAMEKAADFRRLPMLMENVETLDVQVIGKVNEVCQAEGCWLNMDIGDGHLIHVTFDDEAFVVPKDLAGKKILIAGTATKEIIPVDMARKIARDEGKTDAEINAITEPVIEYSYTATGVHLK